METRLIIAYSMMVAMVLTVAGIIFYLRYNARPRVEARRRLRDEDRHARKLADMKDRNAQP